MFSILKKIIPLFFVLVLSYFALKTLFIPGFFPIHDNTQVQRVFEMKKSLSDGMFPVRWVKDLGYGYGYPIFSFYAPLAYYVGGFISLLGFDALVSTKIMLGLGIILSGITMYFFAKEFWGEIGGVISSMLYLFAPYQALNIFVRGDFAEIWAYVFIPLVFLGIHKISQRQSPKFWIIFSSLSFAAIIISHNLTAMMVTPFIISYALVLTIISSRNNRQTLAISYSLFAILGLLLSAFYWLPTLTEMKYTNVASQVGGGADFKDHFICVSQLWNSPWGFGGSTKGCASDGLSFRIGKLHLILAALSLMVLAILGHKQKDIRKQIIFFIISFLVSLFFMIEMSKPIWDTIPQMAYFQYPWRFLIFASFSVSFLGGSIIVLSKSIISRLKYQKIISLCLGIIVISAIILINSKLFNPQFTFSIQSADFTNDINLKWKTSKISDEYMPKNFAKPQNENEISNSKFTSLFDKTKIKVLEDKTQQFSAKITSLQNTKIFINLAYFPAWQVHLDNSPIAFKIFNKGLEVSMPKGEHLLTVKFVETPIEKFANLLTLAGVIGVFIGIITSRKERLHAKKTT